MREELTGKKTYKGGSSTIEMLIAFSVLVLSITAVIVVSFGNQTVAVDAELSNQALYKAERELERAYASSTSDFLALSSLASVVDGLFTKKVDVFPDGNCLKHVSSVISWDSSPLRSQEIILSTVFGNTDELKKHGNNCIVNPLSSGWENPGSLVDKEISGQGPTDIDVKDNIVYLTFNNPSLPKSDLIVYEFATTTQTLSFLGEENFKEGFNAIDVAEINGSLYAFIASASTTAQFQVIDVSVPGTPVRVAAKQLPGVNPAGTNPEGMSIYYYDNRVYVGTKWTGGIPPDPGPEFHIFDVVDPTNPGHLGSRELTHHANDIVVQGDYAYIASSDHQRELMVIDISDPTNLLHPDITGLGFDAPGTHDGTSVYVAGEKIYLGRMQNDPSPSDDFFIFDNALLLDGTSISDGLLGSRDLGIQNGAVVVGIVVRGRIAFVGLDDSNAGLHILNISVTNNIVLNSACGELNFSENSTGIDMEGDFLFVSSGSQKDLRVIYDKPTQC